MRKLLIILLSIFPFVANATSLKCNFSAADISIIKGESVILAGFAARDSLTTEIHLPIFSNCLVITNGEKKICIISNDLMEISPAQSLEIREAISERSGLDINDIFLHCIHTHSAPRVGGACSLDPDGTNYTYRIHCFESIISNAVKTITEESSFRECTIETGRGKCFINANRCEKEGPVDHTLYAVRFIDKNGKPICAFVNYACHPVCMGPRSYLLSSDYSGFGRKIVSEEWGCPVFQISGGSGNMDPAQGPKDYEYAEECGREYARAVESIKFVRLPKDATIIRNDRVAHLPYRIPVVTKDAVRKHAAEIVEQYSSAFPRFESDVNGWVDQIMNEWDNPGKNYESLDINMHALNIGGLLLFFTQGEPFCEYQIQARQAFPDQTLIFAGYTNGQSSYIASERAYQVRKGYEYETDQMHVYIKSPYPLSDQMPQAFMEAINKTVAPVAGLPEYSIIPLPQELIPANGRFLFRKHMKISCPVQFSSKVNAFSEQFNSASGFRIKRGILAPNGIRIRKNESLQSEGYKLNVSEKSIVVEAKDEAGVFYALQTIKQLLPEEVFSRDVVPDTDWSVPCCTITDYPRFSYRGMQLDCGRYFFPKEDVFKFIDLMAMHKQNYLHWHLTEDQGWRIEIKKYPELTSIGAWREETKGRKEIGDGIPHGGFYSQDDIREIVRYAQERCVTIIPEIEIPGHSTAAIASYPYLSCNPEEPKKVATEWGVKNDVFIPSPETFSFLEDVLDEVCELFPSKYFHIGGDECPKDAWRASEYCHQLADSLGLESVDDLQYYFVKHFDEYLRAKGKTVIGWDEILDGSAVESTVVMSYRGHNPGVTALEKNMKTIFCPNRWFYFDYDQAEVEDIPSNHHLFITLRKNYNYEPMVDKELWAEKNDLILGYQACLWTEEIPTSERLLEQTLPREASTAEFCWTIDQRRNWFDFRHRLIKELGRYDAIGVNYSKAFYNVLVNMNLESDYPREVELELDYPFADIRYTTDGTDPTVASPVVPYLITVNKGDILKARGFDSCGEGIGEIMVREF